MREGEALARVDLMRAKFYGKERKRGSRLMQTKKEKKGRREE